MPLVKAKCVTPAWDSNAATMYVPDGGSEEDGRYLIDLDGPLAKLKLGSTYVFQFDRCDPFGDTPHDYSCKKAGCFKKFKTLNELGTHIRSEHKEVAVVEEEAEDEEVDLSDRTCFLCKPAKVLRSAYGLRLHNEKSHPFESQPEKVEAVTTTA